GEFVNDDDFRAFVAILDDVVLVALIEDVGAQALLNVVIELDIGRVVEVSQVQELFDLQDTFFGEGGGAMFFIDGVIAGGVLFTRLAPFDHFAANQLGNDAVDLVVLVGGLFTRAGNDERRARFVDEDGVYFVDDGVLVDTLDAILQAKLHIVAEVIEA